MVWSELQSNWSEFGDLLKKNWRSLNDDDLQRIDGDRDELLALLQRRFGFTAESAEREVTAFERSARLPVAMR
jgi:uncharacterized protein YjbJ (UPF0337 family)